MVNITKRSVNTYKILSVISDNPAFLFGEFKESRIKHGMSTARFEKCFKCNHRFTNDEPVYFACVSQKGNVFFCKDCADECSKEIRKAPTD